MVTALYRRYRPETFADLIGQAQVTDPLMTALRTNRVNHAYLFSGPRGCGKTTSARILARCLNCAEGPTDTPCGVCPSCVELSRDGSGSLDVVEIDAASHNGVDDARDLRERAIFAPARDRFKIFILDEAHMVTPQGFNALLKIVEEPPEHVKFIFATTEPDKVIGTIRSRTHHYPFRLIPPAQMLDYVQQLCDSEHVGVEAGVLPLVVRAGGGSARDTLSLLDQLMAGSEGDSVDYERAVALLGYTHTALLDEVVEALAARDSGAAFSTVDRVIQTGQDPRRFVDDLLERLRDLIVVAATGENAAAVLRGLPQDELDKMLAQARAFGIAELSRTADVVNEALTQMTGATSPRLHLELMMARILVPAADDSARGALARVERLERRIGVEGASPSAAGASAAAPSVPSSSAPASSAPASSAPASSAPASRVTEHPVPERVEGRTSSSPQPVAGQAAQTLTAPAAAVLPAPAPRVGPVTLQLVRDAWPEVVARVEKADRKAWMIVLNTQVGGYSDDEVLTLVFANNSDLADFKARHAPGTGVAEVLRTAVLDVLGVRVKYLAKVAGADDGSGRSAPPPVGSVTAESSAWSTPSLPQTVPAPAQAPSSSAPASSAPGSSAPGPAAAVLEPVEEQPAPGGRASWPTVAPARGAPVSAPVEDLPPASHQAPTTPEAASVPEPATAEPATPAAASTPAPTPEPAPVPEPASAPVPAPVPESVDGPTAPPAQTPAAAPSVPSRSQSVPSRQQAPARGPAASDALGSRTVTWDVASIPTDDDAPPPDDEPPYPDPFESAPSAGRPSQAAPASSPSQSAAPAAGPAPDRRQPPTKQRQAPPVPTSHPAGDNRYGESVVRELLGATFIEEQPHEPRSGGR
ncbi:MAG TPA: DNA polymerase III subunit gamma and tau [Plantibacter sp.]|uniref:DNA polymerase III subunit gamma and tau n=1 Tax=unclassified Plantibacter TaxID=2624265 RepID=UPI002BA65205|nr:DNA polymerase III subunit gamma and tau [Plantibacter sp.]